VFDPFSNDVTKMFEFILLLRDETTVVTFLTYIFARSVMPSHKGGGVTYRMNRLLSTGTNTFYFRAVICIIKKNGLQRATGPGTNGRTNVVSERTNESYVTEPRSLIARDGRVKRRRPPGRRSNIITSLRYARIYVQGEDE